jgi:hypothetical protein
MKRRLTLAIGCLAAAMPSVASAVSSSARAVTVAPAVRMKLPGAAQVVQAELERRGLASAHSIASVVFLKGVQPGVGHYDVRIEPPAMVDGVRLRGFAVAMDGGVEPLCGFRTSAEGFRVAGDAIFSTRTSAGPPEESGLRSGAGEG